MVAADRFLMDRYYDEWLTFDCLHPHGAQGGVDAPDRCSANVGLSNTLQKLAKDRLRGRLSAMRPKKNTPSSTAIPKTLPLKSFPLHPELKPSSIRRKTNS